MSIEYTLKERGDRYGSFAHHAEISQKLQDILRAEAGWSRLAADQKQALTTICDKVARMLNGDPSYRDNWHDIVGYAKLVDDRMAADESPPSKPAEFNDWYKHFGGPVAPFKTGSMVEVWFRCDDKPHPSPADPSKVRWEHRNDGSDIVRWRYAEADIKTASECFNPWHGMCDIAALLDDLTLVTVKMRDGRQLTQRVGDLSWVHSPSAPHGDIVGWKYA